MELNFIELMGYFNSRSYEGDYRLNSKLFAKLMAITNSKDIVCTYAKNLFKKDRNFELFLLLNGGRIINGYIDENQHIIITSYSTKDIINIKYESDIDDGYYGISSLNIYFDNSEIVLNSLIDSNESWRYKYNILLDNIFKCLLDR